jgi:hypothetical protein
MLNFIPMVNVFNTAKNIVGASFKHLEFTSEVKTSEKFKHVKICKQVTANIQIYSNLSELTTVYKNAVIKTGKAITENDMEKLRNFEVSSTWFHHLPECFSIVKNNTSEELYLYARFLSSNSVYFVDGVGVEKEDILEYLTPSECKKLTEDNSIIYNKTNDILHQVIIRTIKLSNITLLR